MYNTTAKSGMPQMPRAADHGNFRSELTTVLNRCCRENGSNTPDFVLAQYLANCLDAFDLAVLDRCVWYGRCDAPGGIMITPTVVRDEASEA